MMTNVSKYRYAIFSLVILLGVLANITAMAGAPRSESFGMLGFKGFLEPSWPKQPVAVKVAKVPTNSPAYGRLKEADVIVGIGSEKFKKDPRLALAGSVDLAETGRADTKLELLLASGKQVVIELPVMGAYSPTAPYNCPKTDKIINQTVEELIRSIENPMSGKRKLEKYELTPTKSELLGLMATGEKKSIDLVGKLIKESLMLTIDPKQVDALLAGEDVYSGLGLKGGVTTGWGWGYSLITLGEYYLLTKDESVLPAIRTFALGLARGQDAAGLWGHRMASPRYNNRVPGYGQMNQPSLSNFMGMIIALKCGIKDPVLDKAIAKTRTYVESHVDKGGFPYGVHYPQPTYFNNNGTSGSAAICMSLLGNQHAAAYFSKLSAASYDSLTTGHASTFFNPLWTPQGAGLSGPEITHQFFMKSLWYFNGKRHLEGGFPGKDNVGSFAGQALLMYCLPRKALLITGRGADKSIWVDKDTATNIIALPEIDYSGKTTDELIALFSHPWSQVRMRAVNEIKRKLGHANKERHMAVYNSSTRKTISAAERDAILQRYPDENASTVQKIWKVIESGNEREKLTAIMYFDDSRIPKEFLLPYVDKLGDILRDKEETLGIRIAIASALGSEYFRDSNYPYYSDILELVFEEPLQDNPYGERDWKLSGALVDLCETPFSNNLIQDKELFYKAALRFMDHKRQQVRGAGIRMLRDMPLADFHFVADKLVYVLENKDPGYHSYHNALDTADPAIEVMAHLGIKDGIGYLENLILDGTSKWGFRFKVLNGKLPLFGQGAKDYLVKFEEHPNIKKNKEKWRADMLRWIDQVNATNKLISLEEAVAVGKQSE